MASKLSSTADTAASKTAKSNGTSLSASIVKAPTMSSCKTCWVATISFRLVACATFSFTLATVAEIASTKTSKSSPSGVSSNNSACVSRTSLNTDASSVASVKIFALPPTSPALATFDAIFAITADETPSPAAAVTTDMTLAICAAAFAIPAEPVATKSVVSNAEEELSPRPFATWAVASSTLTAAPPPVAAEAAEAVNTASTMVVRGVTTIAEVV